MLSFVLAATQAVLTVLAAASLHAAFPEIGKSFEASHPGVSVTFDFNGSQILEAQLVQGAQADVFASADQRWMEKAVSDGVASSPVIFATNELVIVARPQSAVERAPDLKLPGLKLVICAEAAPCGRYARKALEKMESDVSFGKGFAGLVERNIVSQEENVESVLAKVDFGEADAGIVYRSDVANRQHATLRVIDLPHEDQVPIVYPIAVVSGSKSPALAADFITFVRSSQGREILARYGFAPPPK